MGFATWYFLRPRPGELRPLSRAAVVRFLYNGGELPGDEEGFVRYLEVAARLENRKATKVLRVSAIQHRVLADGTLDGEHLLEVVALAGAVAFGGPSLVEPPPGVIDAGHRFAKRRLEHAAQWKPTEGELATLAELVNRRAGRRIM